MYKSFDFSVMNIYKNSRNKENKWEKKDSKRLYVWAKKDSNKLKMVSIRSMLGLYCITLRFKI